MNNKRTLSLIFLSILNLVVPTKATATEPAVKLFIGAWLIQQACLQAGSAYVFAKLYAYTFSISSGVLWR